MTMNIRCGHKPNVNHDNQKFGISYVLLLNSYIVKAHEISSLTYDKNKPHHLKACEKLFIGYLRDF